MGQRGFFPPYHFVLLRPTCISAFAEHPQSAGVFAKRWALPGFLGRKLEPLERQHMLLWLCICMSVYTNYRRNQGPKIACVHYLWVSVAQKFRHMWAICSIPGPPQAAAHQRRIRGSTYQRLNWGIYASKLSEHVGRIHLVMAAGIMSLFSYWLSVKGHLQIWSS